MQQYLFIPAKYKDCYLAYLLDEFKGQSVIIFVATCNNALRVTLLLRNLGALLDNNEHVTYLPYAD